MTESIGERATRSSVYLLARRVAGYAIRFAAIAVLSRRLSVTEFGVVAIATTCINLMVVFGAGGIPTWVIYDRDAGWEDRAKAAWWLNVVLTTGQIAIASALVPVVVWIYGGGELALVLAALIATFFIEQMRVVPDAVLERRLDFRMIATRDIANDLVTGVLGIAMALAGCGVWSLVLPRLVLSPIFLAITLWLSRWSPGWRAFRSVWRRILHYTLPLIGGSLLHVVTNDGDTLIVGDVLGKTAVGFYNAAYMLANLVGRNVTAVLVQISMPALARLRETTGALGPACVRMYRIIAIVTTPMLGGMLAISDDLVLLIFGPQWMPVVTLLRIFIVFTLVRSITSPSGAICNVIGRTDLTLKIYAVLTPAILGAVVIGVQTGVAAVAIGVTVVRVLAGGIAFAISLRLVGVSLATGLRALVPSTIAAGLMTPGVWFAHVALQRAGVALGVRLAVAVGLGSVCYLVALRAVSRVAFDDLTSTIGRISPKLRRALGRLERQPEAA